MKMRLLLFSVFIIFISSKVNGQWNYHPIQNDSSGFLFSVHQIESDNADNIYCRARAGNEIDIYNKVQDSWKRVFVKIPVGMAIDKNNNLWITSNGDGLVMYDGKDTVTYNHLLMKYFGAWNSWDKPLAAGISCDDKNNVWFGYGPYLFRLAAGELKVFDFEKLGIKKNFYEEEVYFYGDKLVFRGKNGYSMIIFDPENPSDYREIQLTDTTEQENKPKIDEIVINKDDIFCKVTYNWDPYPGKFASIFRFNGDKFDTVAFDYLNEYKSYSIQDFGFDTDGNAVVFASVWDGTNRFGELVYYRDWKKTAVCRTPVIDDPNQPVKTSFMYINSMHLDGSDAWLCWWALGVLKFSANPNPVEENSITIENKAIFHPESESIELTGSVFNCAAEIYSVLGDKILFDSRNGIIDVSSLPGGLYFIKIGNYISKFMKY